MDLHHLLPSRTVVTTRWSNKGSRWRTKPLTLAVLLLGLWLFGTGEAFLVDAGIGVSPWTVLAQGISHKAGISIGWATFAISVVVLLAWIPLRERPGLGTMLNVVFVAMGLGVMVWVLPTPHQLGWQVLEVLAGVATIGIASGLYLTSNLGPGPRDGMMTGLHERSGLPVSRVRLGIELVVLAIGWLLGGTVGLGTVLFAGLIGVSVGYGLRLCAHLSPPPHPSPQP